MQAHPVNVQADECMISPIPDSGATIPDSKYLTVERIADAVPASCLPTSIANVLALVKIIPQKSNIGMAAIS